MYGCSSTLLACLLAVTIIHFWGRGSRILIDLLAGCVYWLLIKISFPDSCSYFFFFVFCSSVFLAGSENCWKQLLRYYYYIQLQQLRGSPPKLFFLLLLYISFSLCSFLFHALSSFVGSFYYWHLLGPR